MGVPQAIVVSHAGRHFAPPRPLPEDCERGFVSRQLRDVLALAVGLWPLTSVVLLAAGLLWMAGMGSSP
jgi:nitrate reductase NapE component